jgi:UPF0271 protein
VDLNADVGEGFDTDDALIGIVTSASVACGFHAGDAETMRAACRAAVSRGVAVGAHVSYRDRDGFGRRELDAPAHVVREEVAEQIAALGEAARLEGARVRYVKPHGALYHRASVDHECAAAIVAAAGGLAILAFPGSKLLARARVAVAEGFADRAYTADGTLASRSEPGAVLDAAAAARQAVELAPRVGSICVHGDSPDAPAIAARVRAALEAAGHELRPFA